MVGTSQKQKEIEPSFEINAGGSGGHERGQTRRVGLETGRRLPAFRWRKTVTSKKLRDPKFFNCCRAILGLALHAQRKQWQVSFISCCQPETTNSKGVECRSWWDATECLVGQRWPYPRTDSFSGDQSINLGLCPHIIVAITVSYDELINRGTLLD